MQNVTLHCLTISYSVVVLHTLYASGRMVYMNACVCAVRKCGNKVCNECDTYENAGHLQCETAHMYQVVIWSWCTNGKKNRIPSYNFRLKCEILLTLTLTSQYAIAHLVLRIHNVQYIHSRRQ